MDRGTEHLNGFPNDLFTELKNDNRLLEASSRIDGQHLLLTGTRLVNSVSGQIFFSSMRYGYIVQLGSAFKHGPLGQTESVGTRVQTWTDKLEWNVMIIREPVWCCINAVRTHTRTHIIYKYIRCVRNVLGVLRQIYTVDKTARRVEWDSRDAILFLCARTLDIGQTRAPGQKRA